ncbi:MAG: sigma factor-like helix-turn-helix DNA-binding protein, partial [Planctomycetota bacterium]
PSQEDQADLGPLRMAVSELSEADRTVIELRHFADMSFAQIAEILTQPIGTVLARHHRALRKLKTLIEERAITKASSRTA